MTKVLPKQNKTLTTCLICAKKWYYYWLEGYPVKNKTICPKCIKKIGK